MTPYGQKKPYKLLLCEATCIHNKAMKYLRFKIIPWRKESETPSSKRGMQTPASLSLYQNSREALE